MSSNKQLAQHGRSETEGHVRTLEEGSESLLGDPVGCFPEDRALRSVLKDGQILA